TVARGADPESLAEGPPAPFGDDDDPGAGPADDPSLLQRSRPQRRAERSTKVRPPLAPVPACRREPTPLAPDLVEVDPEDLGPRRAGRPKVDWTAIAGVGMANRPARHQRVENRHAEAPREVVIARARPNERRRQLEPHRVAPREDAQRFDQLRHRRIRDLVDPLAADARRVNKPALAQHGEVIRDLWLRFSGEHG